MNITAWKKLTKDAFPKGIKKDENIACTIANPRLHTYTIYYRSRQMYIIAIDNNHKPAHCRYHKTMVHDNCFFCIFQAEQRVHVNEETGEITEKKYFIFEDYIEIPVDDENLEYCRYKVLEDILD